MANVKVIVFEVDDEIRYKGQTRLEGVYHQGRPKDMTSLWVQVNWDLYGGIPYRIETGDTGFVVRRFGLIYWVEINGVIIMTGNDGRIWEAVDG